MLLIREVMYCKPGKVKALVGTFQAMNQVMQKAGMGKMRILTDVASDRYWTLIAEMEVPTLAAFEKMMYEQEGMSPEIGKEMESAMKGYHDLVEHGRREIYRIEG